MKKILTACTLAACALTMTLSTANAAEKIRTDRRRLDPLLVR